MALLRPGPPRRLFFLVCPTTPWPETFLASPYFRWTRPWVKAQAVAYLRAVGTGQRLRPGQLWCRWPVSFFSGVCHAS